MEAICNIQVLLQAAEFLERRERGNKWIDSHNNNNNNTTTSSSSTSSVIRKEAEHGYASVAPLSPDDTDKRNKHRTRKLSSGGNRSVHNELEKNRRAQLRHCLEQLKQEVPLSSDSMRNTTLNLLRRAQLHIKKLQEQDEHAEQQKLRLRWEQRELRVRLEQLQRASERMRNDSLGSTVSSERSDSDREDVEVDVESIVFDCVVTDGLSVPQTGVDHCYSSLDRGWL